MNIFKKIRNKKKESGQAMVEFALVLPFLVMLICFIADFGWAFACKNELTSLAGKSARYAAILASNSDNTEDIKNEVTNYVKNNIINGNKDKVTVDVINPDGSIVTVNITEESSYITGLTGIFTGGSNNITLKASASSPVIK